MLTEQEIQEEIELITKIISHPAGYDVDLFGTFCVRPTDQGVWEVDWVDGNNKPEYKTLIQLKKPLNILLDCVLKMKQVLILSIESKNKWHIQ